MPTTPSAGHTARDAEVEQGEPFAVTGKDPETCRVTIPQLIARQAARFPDREPQTQ